MTIFAVMKLNVEELRDFCLSLGDDVEEKMPFSKFHSASEVLVFYVCGHMFCYYDLAHFSVVTVKCQPERIEQLRAGGEVGIVDPYNMSPRHWVGLDAQVVSTSLAYELVQNSYNIVKAKYSKKKR